jgi:hypothetical protein
MNVINTYAMPLLQPLMKPPVSYLVLIIVALYAVNLQRPLPSPLGTWMNKSVFRTSVLALILWWMGNNDPVTSIMTAVALTVAMNLVSGKPLLEFFSADEYAITAVMPGCLDVTTKDLLAAFGGDSEKLLNTMVKAGVPHSVRVNDDYAPLIATYLINVLGITVTSACTPPS